MQPDRIDFSNLDPSRDGPRWEGRVQAIAARAFAGHQNPVLWQLTAWARPALAMAALAALVCWLPALAEKEAPGTASRAATDGARALSEWAANPPSSSARRGAFLLGRLAMSQDTTVWRIHVLSGLLLLGTFLAGGAAGVGLAYALRAPGHPRPPEPPPFPRQFQELGLSAAQQQQAEAIFARHRPELDAVLQESYPKVRAINERMEAELRAILTPEQAQRLDALKARRPPHPPHGADFGRGPPEPGPPPPGGGPPPPPPP